MIKNILKISRTKKQLIAIFFDSLTIIIVLLASFSIRLGYLYFPENDVMWLIFTAPFIAIPIFARFGLYKVIIRYIGTKALWTIINAVSLYALLWGIFVLMTSIDGIPRSVIIINWLLSIILLLGIRVTFRSLINGNFHLPFTKDVFKLKRKQTLVYGAGEAGIQLVSVLEHSSEYFLVGFVDDSMDLHGNQIKGLNIYSSKNIGEIIKKHKVDEVLIALPSLSRQRHLSIINELEKYPVVVRLLPSLTELAEGKISINDLREVNIKDLLGREAVISSLNLLSKNIINKVVLVTGAGGSIGSELCRQILFFKPKLLILYEQSELALYNIEKELLKINNNSIRILPILGSVNNKGRLSNVFKKFQVKTTYHAAAYKHVPIVEFNNTEGVNNNTFGTLSCAQVAINEGVETFVLISTDKAVRPTNTMGATKRSAELILQALSKEQVKTKFTMVRFGNVLGSSGSVIPLFKKQIKEGGPVTVTDKNIFRYFMTVEEAVELVIQAGAMGTGGEVFVLDMGEPVSINDLAEKMIRLSGLEVKNNSNPDGDIEIKYTGLRPGEKLFEELLIGNNVSKTINPQIMRAEEDMLSWNELEPLLHEIKIAIEANNLNRVRILLTQIVPEFKPKNEISDLLFK